VSEQPSGSAGGIDEKKQLIILGVVAVSFVGLGSMWRAALSFLVGLKVLSPAGPQVVLVIPSGGGIGLDGPRCWIAAAAALLVVGLLVRQRVAHQQAQET
jgi:fructose-specific phosphotransferase system IIC component